ncbi:MAG: THUMP domain-containing protein [Candidatus Woesearchaeota archaeon]|nr:THUMP domain-containing protein [Candidatus Woesearchaeota archaeon]
MFVGITVNGIEDVASKEVKGKKVLNGRVLFKKELKNYRCLDIVYKLIYKFEFDDFEDLIKKLIKIKFKIKDSFKVECNRKGQHNFKSVDITKELNDFLIKKGYNLDYKNPKTIVYVDIVDNNCLVGYLLKYNLHKRDYRIKINNQSINACLAYALLELSDYKKTDILVDPFCKDGVICIEAALLKGKKIYGMDENKNNIRNAKINSQLAKVKIDFSNYDIEWLSTKFKKKSVKIVTNLFISIRNEQEYIRILPEFFNQVDYTLKDKIGIITTKPELIKKYVGKLKLEHERKIVIGGMIYYILILKKFK